MNAPKRKLLITTLTVAMATCLLSGFAIAQDTTGGSTAGGTTTGTTDTNRTTTDDNHTDYGWLGLLGLAGLAGLMKKPDRVVTHETRVTPPGTGTGTH